MKLAEMMNVSRQAISRWEVGTAVPSTDNLKYLGRLYNVSLEYLLHDDAPDPEIQESEKNIKISGTGPKSRILILIAIMVAVAVFLYVIFLRDEPKKSVPMNEIERSEVETDNTNDFELDF